MQVMRRTGAKVIIMEPYYDRKTADLVASRIGGTVLILPPSVGGLKGLNDYVSVMNYDITQLANAVR
jgi:ABC-type Zn uptake system ZnuABC Zn-binding protein ZnuA